MAPLDILDQHDAVVAQAAAPASMNNRRRSHSDASSTNGSSNSSLDFGSQHSTFTAGPSTPFKPLTIVTAVVTTTALDPSSLSQQEEEASSKRRSVTFHKSVKVKHIRPLSKYTDAEYIASWIQPEDMTRIKAEFKVTLNLMIAGKLDTDTEEHCQRGVEQRLPHMSKQRQLNKIRSRKVVLTEQERQWENFEQDAEGLAVKYMQSTRHCQSAAYRLARIDEARAKSLYQ